MRNRFLLWEDKLLFLSLLAFFYAYSSPVRVATRSALEGRDFSWGYASGLTPDGKVAMAWGKGLFGHTDYILFLAFAIIWILAIGLRRPDGFFRWALAGWTSIGFGVGLWLAVEQGDSLASNKETLGLTDLSYFWTEVFPAGLAWALAILLLVKGSPSRRSESAVPWMRLNTVLMIGAAGFLALAAILLNIGPQNGTAEFHGVGVTYVSFILFLLGLAPWMKEPKARSRAGPDANAMPL